jgi:hypothetical protein
MLVGRQADRYARGPEDAALDQVSSQVGTPWPPLALAVAWPEAEALAFFTVSVAWVCGMHQPSVIESEVGVAPSWAYQAGLGRWLHIRFGLRLDVRHRVFRSMLKNYTRTAVASWGEPFHGSYVYNILRQVYFTSQSFYHDFTA